MNKDFLVIFLICQRQSKKRTRKHLEVFFMELILMTGMNYLNLMSCLLITYPLRISCTIDINLSELEYIASHLDPFECRRLVAALHYSSHDLPKSLSGAERKVNEEIPCLRQLLHWNMSTNEGKGKTHEELERRLRQMNRNDLADWLGKETFKQLGKDLGRALDHPFGELGEEQTEISESTKPKNDNEEIKEESPRKSTDTTESNYESEEFEI